MKKAQSSMEFVILTSFMLMSFLVFYIIIQGKLVESNRDKIDINAKQIETLVINELKLAESVTDGYYREFTLPREIMGKNYSVEILSGVDNTPEIVIKYLTKERVYFVPKGHIYNLSNISRGRNNISKVSGVIYIQYMGS